MKTLLVFALLLTAPLYICGQSPADAVWVDSTLNRMSLDQKIGQLLIIAAYSNQNDNYENELEKQIRKYHIGGLIFFQGDPVKQVQLTNRYQQAAECPLFIGMDAEHGIGWRLKTAMEFPKMLIEGALRNDSLIYQLGAAIANHCHELGVHINFAPVVDINSNPSNPIIGMRSFGEQREEITRKAILYMQGSLSRNVLPVAKHFPGHGDTDSDSHHTLPVITHSRTHLDSIELYPYRRMISAEIPAIMTSHLEVIALDSSCPASLSPAIINGILKEELGFRGLCFTDAMNMKGVTQHTSPGEAEVKALLAGNDVLLFPENPAKAVASIRQAIRDSILSEELINQKCRKILLAKYRYVLPNIYPSQTPGLWSRINTSEDFALKQNLYKSAVTLVKNTDSLLPLQRLDTLRIASLNYGSNEINNFQTMLARYTRTADFTIEKKLSGEEIKDWKKKLSPYNCIIIYNNIATNSPGKKFGYTASLANLIRELSGKRIILCHPGIPYGLTEYSKLPLDALLVCYENHPYARQFSAQAIFGGISINGRLPVSISAAYPAGTGLTTPKTRLGYLSPEMCGIKKEKLNAIDSLCEMAIRLKATPGCQVLIARNGNIFYNKAYGYHTYQQEKPNHTSDIYDIASVTKITATLPALMKLYEERLISLTAPLSDYYSPLRQTDKKNITVREILCHNAGLKTYLPLFADAIDKKSLPGPLFTTRPTAANKIRLKEHLYVNPDYRFRDSTISNTPRSGYEYVAPGIYLFPGYRDSIFNAILTSPLNAKKEYAYSDLGFILLKEAVENISRQPLDQFCKDTFYSRLGMNNTDFNAAVRLNKNRIVPSCEDKLYRKTTLYGYVHDPTAALLGGIAGHAGLFSTAEDLAKILQMYLNQGVYGGETYFSPETVATFTGKNELFALNRRALGFDKPEPDTTKAGPTCHIVPLSSYGHTGFTGIIAWCDPENDLLYIFLSNRTYPNEFNTKLSEENIRTQIQELIYESLGPATRKSRFVF